MKDKKIKIIFGEEAVRKYEEGTSKNKLKEFIQTYSFKTDAEVNSFLLGLKEALGWEDYQIIK